ncbi:MAG: mechanosensitive ion channel [Nitrososphaerota archaeon]|nr:mechanosensitive ion channel [Nitrososphaerota archaeon]
MAVVAVELLSIAIRRAAKLAGAGPTVIRDVREGMRVIAILIAISAILSFTKLASEFTALTISGIAGLALSLALQTTLSNVIAGILMINDGVIRLGDRIEYGGSLKGEVVRVALRNAWVRTSDGNIAVISNSNLSAGPLVNYTATERLKKKYAIG